MWLVLFDMEEFRTKVHNLHENSDMDGSAKRSIEKFGDRAKGELFQDSNIARVHQILQTGKNLARVRNKFKIMESNTYSENKFGDFVIGVPSHLFEVVRICLEEAGSIGKKNLNRMLKANCEDKWEEILEIMHKENKWFSNVLWVRPCKENLHFISDFVISMGLKGVVSIGCGTGLLESLIEKATGLRVIGLEKDRAYWTAQQTPKAFIPLLFPDDDDFHKFSCSDKYALMFCYFNYRQPFDDYIKNYEGACVIIIGPGSGRGTHTDPEPFNPMFHYHKWKLSRSQEIRNTKDYIAIYVRQ